MKHIQANELPTYINHVAKMATFEVINAVRSLMEDVYTRTASKTRFSFQHWELEEREEGGAITFVLRLPFRAHGGPVQYTSNLWNNPYFAERLGQHASKIHQPLQEALLEVGLHPSPDLGEPITPVSWPSPPRTAIRINASDILNKVEEALQRALAGS